MAQFEVREVFRLSSGPSVAFAGRILDGYISPGMAIQLELQPRLNISTTIRSVEFLDRVSAGESLVTLLCDETDPQEAVLYSELCPPGTVISIQDSAIRPQEE